MATRSGGGSERRSDSAGYVRFLNAAEELFGTLGYDGTKIRAIASKSGVNLGALHHYWGSKQALYRAVCERRLLPLNEERQRRFDECERQTPAGQPPDLRALIRAVVEPPFLLAGAHVRQRKVFHRFLGRALTEPSTAAQGVIRASLEPTSRRFLALLRVACGHLSDNQFFWRVNGFYGVMVYAPAFSERIVFYAGDRFDPTNLELGADEVVEFLVAGMQAPPARGH